MKDGKKNAGKIVTVANPTIHVISNEPSATGGMCDVVVEIDVTRHSNEDITGDSSLGLTVEVDGTAFQNLPEKAGSPVLNTSTGAWKHTFVLETLVTCGDSHEITAELAYIIRPAPKVSTPITFDGCECGGSGGGSSSPRGSKGKR